MSEVSSGDPPLMIMVMPLSVQLLSSVDGNEDQDNHSDESIGQYYVL